MLEVYLWVSVYLLYLTKRQKPIVEQIKGTYDLGTQITLRKNLKRLRHRSLLVFLLLFIGVRIGEYILLNMDDESVLIQGLIMGPFMLYIVLKGVEGINPMREISLLTKKDVTDSQFVLFLRSFSKDDYAPEQKLKRFKKDCKNFSEYQYCIQLKKYLPVYAVGMTREIEVPSGAKRFYLSDTTWKEDVYYLMQKASIIVILVDDRDSCLWEIAEGEKMSDKIIYIVDDMNKYCQVQAKTPQIPFPYIPYYPLPLSIHISGDNAEIYTFQHTKASYKQLVEYHVKKYLNGASKTPFYQNIIIKILLNIVCVIASIVASAIISRVYGDGYNNVTIFFISIGLLFLCIIIGNYYLHVRQIH